MSRHDLNSNRTRILLKKYRYKSQNSFRKNLVFVSIVIQLLSKNSKFTTIMHLYLECDVLTIPFSHNIYKCCLGRGKPTVTLYAIKYRDNML